MYLLSVAATDDVVLSLPLPDGRRLIARPSGNPDYPGVLVQVQEPGQPLDAAQDVALVEYDVHDDTLASPIRLIGWPRDAEDPAVRMAWEEVDTASSPAP